MLNRPGKNKLKKSMRKKNVRTKKASKKNVSGSHLSLLSNSIKALPVVLGVAAIFYLVTLVRDVEMPTVMAVENVEVIGELRFIDRDRIIDRVNENITGGYFAVDIKQVRQSLLQEPWVKEASLRRTWPADVRIYIEEHKPIAFWNDDGFISETGDVFKPSSIDTTLDLPQLEGPDNQHENVLRFMNRLYKRMAALNYQVKRLSLDDRRAWQLAIIHDAYISKMTDQDVGEMKHSIDVKPVSYTHLRAHETRR